MSANLQDPDEPVVEEPEVVDLVVVVEDLVVAAAPQYSGPVPQYPHWLQQRPAAQGQFP